MRDAWRRGRLGPLDLGLLTIDLEPRRWPPSLTPTEREVARGLLRGHGYTHIARDLGCRRSTVATHVRALLTKLDVDSSSELVALLARS